MLADGSFVLIEDDSVVQVVTELRHWFDRVRWTVRALTPKTAVS